MSFKSSALKQRAIIRLLKKCMQKGEKQRNKKGEKERTSNTKEAGSLESVFSLLRLYHPLHTNYVKGEFFAATVDGI